MKKQKLVKYLTEHGCCLVREGSSHEYWRNDGGTGSAAVPRHKEVKAQTIRSICRDLGIPAPVER